MAARQKTQIAVQEKDGDAPTIGERIDGWGLGFSQLFIGICAGGVWLADGSELLLISSVTREVAEEWVLDPLQRGFVVTIVFFGILVGNFLSGPYADALGRRQPIVVSYVGIFFFSILSSYAVGFYTLCCTRFFVGMSFGIGQPACNGLIMETSPSRWRIVMMTFIYSLFIIGEAYSAFLILADDPMMVQLQWRRLLRLGALPALCLGTIAFTFLVESPAWLALNGRDDEAKEVLETIRDANYGPPGVDFKPPTKTAAGSQMSFSSRFAYIFGPHLKGTTFILMYSCFTLNFCYYGCLYAFPQVLPDLEMSGSPAVQLLVGALWEEPGFVLGAILGLQVARKPSIRIYLFGLVMTVGLFIVGAGRSGQSSFLYFALMAGYYGSKAFLGMGFLLVYLYSSEVFPTEARVTGNAVCLAAGRVAGMIAPLVFELLLDATGHFSMFFVCVLTLALLNFFLIPLLPFETFGMTLKDHAEPNPEDTRIASVEKRAYGAAGP